MDRGNRGRTDKMCVPDVLRGWDALGTDRKQDRTQQKPGLSAADDKGCIPEKNEDKIKKFVLFGLFVL